MAVLGVMWGRRTMRRRLTGLMLARSFPMIGSRRSLRVLERNAMIYRAQWVMLVSGFFEPLFYLLSIGIGLNKLVETSRARSGDQLRRLAPADLGDERRHDRFDLNTFFRLKISHSYDAILATPLGSRHRARRSAVGLSRATVYSASFIVCMAALGDTSSPWVIFCWPGAI